MIEGKVGKVAQKVTIYDVAKRAGVSKTSVSRYLGGRLEELAEKTKKKIESAIQELDYRPSTAARGLKGRKSYLIGVIIADIRNPYSTAILRGAEEISSKNGYSLMICNSDNDPEKEKNFIHMLQSHRIDGLIIHTTGGNNSSLLEMKDDSIPVVLLDRNIPELDMDFVGLDNRTAIKDSLEFLLQQDYQRIAFFSEPFHEISTRHERYQFFQDVLKKNNHESSEDIYIVSTEDSCRFRNKLLSFLEDAKGQSRAIFTVNALLMLKIANELNTMNISVPDELSLLTFDNPDWAPVVFGGITCIEQPTFEIGVSAMNMVLERIRGERTTSESFLYKGKLIKRNSTPLM
ncbi:LacI family DNA-binding transcriptional regulator [Fictibacillus fluitans]|uniref:LacI family DNA-binding transcriptional regulator n=1 Tax=Fictibacillus fluitans TaxID=3058422 RepID=A0ABT8HZW9_9BACL|nr:LacI family DNA-binding transcriptional regulator [Fictibacillus sp. NE201]MDN4526316.1 LacI family DNA-binding transcriptional regulator [Fictibacillus sp. NE201]